MRFIFKDSDPHLYAGERIGGRGEGVLRYPLESAEAVYGDDHSVCDPESDSGHEFPARHSFDRDRTCEFCIAGREGCFVLQILCLRNAYQICIKACRLWKGHGYRYEQAASIIYFIIMFRKGKNNKEMSGFIKEP